MKKMRSMLISAIIAGVLAFSGSAMAAGVLGTNVQTIHGKKQFAIGATYFGYQGGGPNFTGSYFLSDNLAFQADIGFLNSNTTAGVLPVSFTYYDVLGVYHAALTDLIGVYVGIGFDWATIPAVGVTPAQTVNGVGYTVGAEALLTNNLYGKVGFRSGVFEVGLETTL